MEETQKTRTSTEGLTVDEVKKICKGTAGKDRTDQMLCVVEEELEQGFDFVKKYPEMITFLGSARTKPDDIFYQKAVSLGARLVKEFGVAIATGGGPGIMEAGNKGAKEAGGQSLGMSIQLPSEQYTNPYLTDGIDFHFFFTRKVFMCYSAKAYVFFPGGLGTLNEFFEVMTLLQTKKMMPTPVFLMGTDYWKPLEDYIIEDLEEQKFTDEGDDHLYLITDSEDEIIDTLKRLLK